MASLDLHSSQTVGLSDGVSTPDACGFVTSCGTGPGGGGISGGAACCVLTGEGVLSAGSLVAMTGGCSSWLLADATSG